MLSILYCILSSFTKYNITFFAVALPEGAKEILPGGGIDHMY